jgi:amino acid transporter
MLSAANETDDQPPPPEEEGPDPRRATGRLRRILLGKPHDLRDSKALHRMSLVAFLAWVGLGADGLSSSAYGPEEAFRALGPHGWLALVVAAATAATVLVLSVSYSGIIEKFPTGGGGYVVASHLLGARAGLVSGCALVVDYVLTITVSIASGASAVFSFLPAGWQGAKVPVAAAAIVLLVGMNLRGVKESVEALLPIFLVFLATHILLIGGSLFTHLADFGPLATRISTDARSDFGTLGWVGLALVAVRAYSLGGGTFTGIEAVSNGLAIMREPRVATGRKTMTYMAISLAITAAGILVGYLLFQVAPVANKTMNAVLAERLFESWPAGRILVLATLASEGLLLFVAAQAGFIDGPRVMANMAIDSWLPHRFSSLSEQLTMQNGVLLMGGAALGLLVWTQGNLHVLVVMYSINVFVTFTLSQLAMTRYWWQRPGERRRRRSLGIHGSALVLCASILAVTLLEKFSHGGWVTVLLTSAFVVACLAVRAHYRSVESNLRALDEILGSIPVGAARNFEGLDPNAPTAVLLVGSFSGLGVHTLLSTLRTFPGLYRQFVFISVAVVDSGAFKGSDEIAALEAKTRSDLARYVDLARGLGFAAEADMELGTEVVDGATDLSRRIAARFPRGTIFAGRLVFRKESRFHRLLHNEFPVAIQRRLQWLGIPMVILPIRATV